MPAETFRRVTSARSADCNTLGKLMPAISRSCFRKASCVLALLLLSGLPLIAQTVRIDTAAPVNAINPRDSVGAGIGNTGFSRITDGDESTYWKSNPYLTSRYTGEDDALHPQWIILDLSREELVDTLKISWAEPYAKDYVLQYWTGADPLHLPARGAWVTFPQGVINTGHGGMAVHPLSELPVPLRCVGIWMTTSSNTCDTHR